MEYHWVLSTAVVAKNYCFCRERVESCNLCSKSRSVPESLPNVSLAFSRRHLGSFSSWLPPGAGVLPALGSAPASTHAPPHSLNLLKKRCCLSLFLSCILQPFPFSPLPPTLFFCLLSRRPFVDWPSFCIGGKRSMCCAFIARESE